MTCPKCNAPMRWKEKSQSLGGEIPAHWSCLKCGSIIWPDGPGGEMKPKRTDTQKQCTHCGIMKGFEEFNKNKTTPDGYEYWCKQCKADRAKKRKRFSVDNEQPKMNPGNPRSLRRAARKQSVTESLFVDPAVIRSLKRSVGKELLSEFSRFLEERYG